MIGEEIFEGLFFVVLGGCFNEFYGWDSYMELFGFFVNDWVDFVKFMVFNFCFCIEYYGKIFNVI